MATEKEIFISINGTQQAIKSMDDLAKATKDVGDAFDDVNDSAEDTSDKVKEAEKETGFLEDRYKGLKDTVKKLGADFKLATKGIRTFFTTGTKGAKALKIAFASTGIGLLVVAIASLVDYFKDTEEGSRVLQVAFESVGVIFNRLVDAIANFGGSVIEAFTNPVETIKNFAQTIQDFVIDRVKQIINGLGLLGTAISKVFEGDFSGAADAAGEALNELFMVDEIAGAVEAAGEAIVETFEDVTSAVTESVSAVNNLVIAQRALRDLNQQLIVDNAQLTKSLEENQKIAEDTTLAYDVRREALDNLNDANIQLAENQAALAAAEEDALRQELALADSYEEREELETSIAEAVATRIEAETALQNTRLDAQKLERELEQEELDRKKAIADTLQQLEAETIQDEEEAARRGLEIAEQQTLAELDQLRASEEEKEAVREQFRILRQQQEEEFAAKRDELRQEEDEKEKQSARDRADLENQVQSAKLQSIAAGFDAIASLQAAFGSQNEEAAKRNFNIQKALSLASATISGTEAVINAYKTAQASPITALFPGYPAVQAGLAGAFAAAQIATIARSKFESPAAPSVSGGEGGGPQLPDIPQFGPDAATVAGNLGQDPGQTVNENTVGNNGQPVIRTYVVANDVTSAQEANAAIDNLARL